MAKLSARGRVCVVEITRERTAAQLQAAHEKQGGTGPAPTTWERVTRRLMSDGKILEQLRVTFPQSKWEREPQRHVYPWKVYAKLKTGVTAARYAEIYRGPTASGKPSAWTVTEAPGVGRPPVLTAARVRRAMAEDETVGFCLACGAERSGCEPDARGYRCGGCGALEVYGAEECLLSL